MLLQIAVEGARFDPETVADLAHRALIRLVQAQRHLKGALVDRLGPTTQSTASPGGLQARHRPLSDQVSLELCERGGDMEEELPGRGRCVDRLDQALEADISLFELVDQTDQLLERAPEAIKSPDDQRVALAQVFDGLVETGSLGSTSGDDVFEDSLAAGARKSIELKFESLLWRRDSGVSDEQQPKLPGSDFMTL